MGEFTIRYLTGDGRCGIMYIYMTGFTIDLNGGYIPMERMSMSDDFVLLEEGQTVWERLTELHKGIK